jgi:hypothetical protein
MTHLISSDFFIPLNFPDIWSELDPLDIAKVTELPGTHPFFNANHFKVPFTILEILKDVRLTIRPTATFLFHCKSKSAGLIHTDGHPPMYQRLVGLNWIWSGENTSMHWYKRTGEPTIQPYGQLTIPYYDHTNTAEIYSAELVGCNLVNIKLPHQIRSNSSKIRYTLSVAFEENPTWEEVSELFKKYKV